MKIVLVVDYFGETTNGTTVTTKLLYNALTRHGHEVKILAGVGNGWKNVYETGYLKIPVLYYFCSKNGFLMAKTNKKVFKEALEGADLVHFLADFPMDRAAKKYCDKHGILTSSAFHIQPENATAQIHLNYKFINSLVFLYYRVKFYSKFNDIHVPSKMIANQLRKHHYKADIHVISNGIDTKFKPVDSPRPPEFNNKYLITMVGRISREKRQDLLIKAVSKSKYAKKIQLILLGNGTWLNKIRKLSKKYLVNQAKILFVKQDELIKILNYCDLYVHASDFESEAISCMEAFACGLVPVISDSKYSATSQFALTSNNTFKKGDYKDLANKIDYWIEHQEEKEELSKKYVEYAKEYSTEKCGDKMNELFVKIVEKANGKDKSSN